MPADNGMQGHGLILVPQAPSVRTIFMGDRGGERFDRVSLFFPHSLFCIFYSENNKNNLQLKRCHVTFSKVPFTGKDSTEKFFGLPLRNHEEAHGICFYNWPDAKNVKDLAKLVINQYWSSPYMEYNDNFSYWNKSYKKTFFTEWKKNTKEQNYDWIYQQDWLQAPYVVDLNKLLEANKSQYSKNGITVLELERPQVNLDFLNN